MATTPWAGTGGAPAAANYTWGGDPAARRRVKLDAHRESDDPYAGKGFYKARDDATGDWLWVQAGEMRPLDTTGMQTTSTGYGQSVPTQSVGAQNPSVHGGLYYTLPLIETIRPPRSDGLDQRAIDADPVGFAQWQRDRAAALKAPQQTPTPGILPAAAQPPGLGIARLDVNSMAGPITEAKTYAPGEDAFVSNQLTKLLTSGNPYLERVRTRALAGANRRGLLNSSMALGAGEAAAIDAALPIAQADANTVGGAERYNVDIGNTFSRDANAFSRQGALAKLGGVISQDTLGQEQTFIRERDTSQFQNRLQEIQALTQADLQRFDAQQGTNLAGDYRRATEGLYGEYARDVARIQESDMDPDVKAAQIAETQSLYTSRQQHLNTVYSNQLKWNDEWAQFALEFGQRG